MRIVHRTVRMTANAWVRVNLPGLIKSTISFALISIVVYFIVIFPGLRHQMGEVKLIDGTVVASGYIGRGRASVLVNLDGGREIRLTSSVPLAAGSRVTVEEHMENMGQPKYYLSSVK